MNALSPHALPVLAGIAFATIGVCYQAAERRGVPPVRLLLFMAAFGAMMFAFRSGSGEWSMPPTLFAWAMLAGFGQYACMKLVGIGMRLGPFSGLWCMLSMDFAPVFVFAAIAQGTLPNWPQRLSVATALLCCAIASTTIRQPANVPGKPRYFFYGLLLFAVLMLNALLKLGIQRLSGDDLGTNRFLCIAYIGIGIGCLADMLFARPTRDELLKAIPAGLAASAGSVCGMLAIAAAAAKSGPRAFLIASIVMLLIPMLVSVFIFREKATSKWIATLALGLVAVALANL